MAAPVVNSSNGNVSDGTTGFRDPRSPQQYLPSELDDLRRSPFYSANNGWEPLLPIPQILLAKTTGNVVK